jgi:hypothetical protein
MKLVLAYCHNPTNKTKQNNLVGVVFIIGKKTTTPPHRHHHHTGCDYTLSHFQAT